MSPSGLLKIKVASAMESLHRQLEMIGTSSLTYALARPLPLKRRYIIRRISKLIYPYS